MYDTCEKRSKSKELASDLGLDDSFSSDFCLLSLHIWMCLGKLRAHGSDGQHLAQTLFDNFWDDMVVVIRSKGVKELQVNKHLVELQEMFFGAALAYDEAVASSDAVLAAALWRNLYGFEVDAQKLEKAVQYVRRESATIDKMDITYFIKEY